jgi:hypothetical protein
MTLFKKACDQFLPQIMSEDLKVVCDVVRKDRFRLKPGPKTLARQREFRRSHEFEMDLVLGPHAGYPEKIDENEIVKGVEELEPCILTRFSRPGLVEVVKTVRREMKEFAVAKENWQHSKYVSSDQRQERAACG